MARLIHRPYRPGPAPRVPLVTTRTGIAIGSAYTPKPTPPEPSPEDIALQRALLEAPARPLMAIVRFIKGERT